MCGSRAKGILMARSGGGGRDYQGGLQQETLGARPGAGQPSLWIVWRTDQARSGREWEGAQSRQSAAELVLPGPALGQMQGETPGRAGEPSGQREEAPPEGLGGCQLLAQADARCPASQIVGHDLDGQPGPLRQAQDWRGNGPRGGD